MEPTSSGTQYIFSLTGRISAKELSVEGGDEDETESSGEESTPDDEPQSENTRNTTAERTNAFPKIIFLGTGSSFPGVLKTVTSILVRIKLVFDSVQMHLIIHKIHCFKQVIQKKKINK